MRDAIRLDPTYGVNPSVGICFWCGEDDGTVLLFGRMKDGKAAPRRACVSLEPCPSCKEKRALGITFEEWDEDSGSPTGRWAVVTEDAVRRMIADESRLAAVLRARMARMPKDSYRAVFDARSQSESA